MVMPTLYLYNRVMTKRHKKPKHATTSVTQRNPKRKAVQKVTEKRRSKNPPTSKAGKSKAKPRSKVVAKTSKVSKRGTPASPTRNKNVRKPTERLRTSKAYTTRRKKAAKSKGKIRSRNAKENKQRELNKREREINKKIAALQEEKENLEIEKIKFAPEISDKHRPKNFITLQKDRNGNTIIDTKLHREREIYTMLLPKGPIDEKIQYVLNTNFSFLNKPLKYNKPFLVRGMIVILHSSDGTNDLYDSSSPTIDMVVNLFNIKKFTVERMRLWSENFMTRLEDAGQTYLEVSGESYNPDYLVSVSYKFIY